jgi:hypothetical protein
MIYILNVQLYPQIYVIINLQKIIIFRQKIDKFCRVLVNLLLLIDHIYII